MAHTLRNYVLREALTGAAVNALLSFAMFRAVFGYSTPPIAVWGVGQIAFDFAAQSFCVAFMSMLIPALIARRAMRLGHIPAGRVATRSVLDLAAHAILKALAVMVAGGMVCAAVLFGLGLHRLDWGTAAWIKTAYGAALGCGVIVVTLPSALHPSSSGASSGR